MAKERKKLTLSAVTAVTKNAPLEERQEDLPKKVKLKDLKKK